MGRDAYRSSQHQPWQAEQQQSIVFKILSPGGGEATAPGSASDSLCGSEQLT